MGKKAQWIEIYEELGDQCGDTGDHVAAAACKLAARQEERIAELEQMLHRAFNAGAAWATGSSRDFKQTHPDRKTWVRKALGGSDV